MLLSGIGEAVCQSPIGDRRLRLDVIFEDHPRFSMGQLRRHGMFVSDVSELAFKIGEAIVSIRYYTEDDTLLLKWKSNGFEDGRLIGLTFAELKFGGRRYFVCPLTGKRTSELHLVGGKWGCRQAFPRLTAKNGSPTQRFELRLRRWRAQLLGEDGYAQAKGKRRARIIEELKLIPYVVNRFPELGQIFSQEADRAIQDKRRQARASVRVDELSTAQALSAGADVPTLGVLDGHRVLGAEILVRRIPQPGGHPLVAAIAELESHAALDVRALARIGLGQTALTTHGLLWRRTDGTEIARALLVVDFQLPDRPFLAIWSLMGADGAKPTQFVRLVPSATAGRWFLECPVLGTRCDILFLRAGRFASAKANRLVHRSQRKAT
jgi:hypothetical protein